MERIDEGIENITQNTESRSSSSSEHSSDSVVVCGQYRKEGLHKVIKNKEKDETKRSTSNTGSLSEVLEGMEDSMGPTHPRELIVRSKSSPSSSQKISKIKSKETMVKSNTSSTSEALGRSEDEVLEARTSYSSDSIITSSRPSQDSSYRLLKGRTKDSLIKSRASSLSGVLEELEDDLLEVAASVSVHNVSDLQPKIMERNVSERVFVQNKKGFEPTTNDKLFEGSHGIHELNEKAYQKKQENNPHEFAVILHNRSRLFSRLCHGLLAGFGLCHVSLVLNVSDNPQAIQTFAGSYPDFARIVQIVYYSLSAICLISVLDRCDVAGLTIHDCGFLLRYRFANILTIVFYSTLLIVTVIAIRWDDRLALSPYNEDLWKNHNESQKEFTQWRILSLLRGLFAVLGYAGMFFGPDDDMFYENLNKLTAYDEPGHSSQDLLKC